MTKKRAGSMDQTSPWTFDAAGALFRRLSVLENVRLAVAEHRGLMTARRALLEEAHATLTRPSARRSSTCSIYRDPPLQARRRQPARSGSRCAGPGSAGAVGLGGGLLGVGDPG